MGEAFLMGHKGKKYKAVYGTEQTSSTSTTAEFRLNFDAKVIAIFFAFGTWINGTVEDASYMPSNFCFNDNYSLFTELNIIFDLRTVSPNPYSYAASGNRYTYGNMNSDGDFVRLNAHTDTASYWVVNYVAILEE